MKILKKQNINNCCILLLVPLKVARDITVMIAYKMESLSSIIQWSKKFSISQRHSKKGEYEYEIVILLNVHK